MRETSYEGAALYVCEACHLDTFDAKKAQEHEAVHPAPSPPPPPAPEPRRRRKTYELKED